MKLKLSRDFVVMVILIPLFLWGAFYISIMLDSRLPAYSVLNKSRMGSSIFYEALQELKYPVEMALEPVPEMAVNSLQIVVPGGRFDINKAEVKSWVYKGGILLYLTPNNFHALTYGVTPEVKDGVSIYKYHDGVVIAADVNHIANKTLVRDTEGAYTLLKLIDEKSRKIYFNEAHLFSSEVKKSLWDFIPLGYKYIIYQLLLTIAAFFYYKGKRFGKNLPLYEEMERSENEYLYSAASLYRQAKCWDLILDNYYKGLLKQLHSSPENWLEHWEKENLPSADKARKVFDLMNRERSKLKAKEYLHLVTNIEHLRSILKKRRDLYWKTLKRTQ